MRLSKLIPNFLTSLNLFSGTIAVVFAFEGQFHVAAILVGIAALFDFLDGFSARLLKAWSPMGKELDSLADLVSFGLSPAVILYRFMQQSADLPQVLINEINILPFLAFLITLFSALRLAKFNIDTRQSESFLGLPTPANAIFIVSIPLAMHYGSTDGYFYPLFAALTHSFWLLTVMVLILSALMVVELPLFSLKFKSLKIAENKTCFVFLFFSFILLMVFHLFAISLIIILYVLLSFAEFLARSKHTQN